MWVGSVGGGLLHSSTPLFYKKPFPSKQSKKY